MATTSMYSSSSKLIALTQQTRGIHTILFQCWVSGEDCGPTLKQHCVNARVCWEDIMEVVVNWQMYFNFKTFEFCLATAIESAVANDYVQTNLHIHVHTISNRSNTNSTSDTKLVNSIFVMLMK